MGAAWVQTYDPLGSAWLSPLVAGTPILVLLGLLVAGVSAPRAALLGLLTALAVAIFAYQMPADAALAAAGYGALFGLLPIGWIVFAAVFLYDLTVRSGQFEVVKRSVASISPDRRIQALLIAFSFGAFLEGAAGFGTPVAISSALLIGLGFRPLPAAGLALIANTSPVAFGALGTPITMLAQVSQLDAGALSQMAGRQLPFFSLVIPAWLVVAMSGWRGLRGCWPAVLVSGGSFAAIQFATSNYHGPTLVDVAGGVGSMVALIVFLRFWKPREVWRFPEEREAESATPAQPASPRLRAGQVAYAWMPWVVLSVMVFGWGVPAWKNWLNGVPDADPPGMTLSRLVIPAPGARSAEGSISTPIVSQVAIPVPRLHQRVYHAAPVARVPDGSDRAAAPEKAVYQFNWLSATGTGIFLAGLFGAAWLRVGWGATLRQIAATGYRVRWALCTILCMLALAFTTKYSGADATLGLAFTRSGSFYPFFAPLLGWLGVALTGSDTSANALFGNLQRITAEQLGLNPLLIVASNSTGGVMGKMIDAQSIVVAAVATRQPGEEGRILRYVFPHSLALALLMGLLTYAQATWLTGMIP